MAKVEKTHAGGTWTKSRYFGFIRSALRSAWSRYPVKWQVLEAAKRKYTGKDKRIKWQYKCNSCKGWFLAKEVQVDHITPAGSLKDYKDLPLFVSNLLCGADNLQVLCKTCHDNKTKEERCTDQTGG